MEADQLSGPISYLEFGVYEGASIRWWLEHNSDERSRFIGFDSFTGLPERWSSDTPEGAFSVGGKAPEIADRRCSFEVGWFHETLPPCVSRIDFASRLVIHLDADLYRSTLFVLTHLGPWIKPGDVLIFDEFSDSIHEFRAFEEFAAIFCTQVRVAVEMDGYERVALEVGPQTSD